jgi:TonB family protein
MTGGEQTAAPVILALGWSLVHFVWQGTVIGVVCWALLKALQADRPAIRYWVGMTSLAAMAAAPVVTFAVVLRDLTAAAGGVAHAGAAELMMDQTATVAAAAESASLASRLEAALPFAVALWLSGVILMVFRLAGDIRQINRLISRDVSPVTGHWEAVMARLAGDLGVRRPVRILESARVSVPLVIGWLKPTILIPPSALLGLTPRQLELIIAHELAHVRRADWLFNLFQVVVETVLFYHPAVRMLSRRIRAEREQCCDDMVVAATGDYLTYARALTEVESLRAALTARMAIGASDGQLAGRVTRLVAPPRTQRGFVQWAPVALLVSSAAITTASLDPWPAASPPVPPEPSSEATPGGAPAGSSHAITAAPIERESAHAGATAPLLVAIESGNADTRDAASVTDGPASEAGHSTATARSAPAISDAAVAQDSRAGHRQESGEDQGSNEGAVEAVEAGPLTDLRQVTAPRSREARAGQARTAPAPQVSAEAESRARSSSPVGLPPLVPVALEARTPGAEISERPGIEAPPVNAERDSAIADAEPRTTTHADEPVYTGGRLVRGDAPDFPRRARTRAEGGTVVVAYTIDQRGRIQDLEFTESSGRDFTLAVKRAMKRWRFEPYALDGTPVARRVARTFDFQLEAGGPALEDDSRCGYATASRLCRRYASAGNPEALPPDPHPVDDCSRVTGSRICGRDLHDQHVVVVYEAN